MNTPQTRDFPDWIGPMLVKELRQGLKARAFELTFIALQVILAIVVGYQALMYAREGTKFNAGGLNGMFWFIVGLQLLAVTPLRALSGLTNERKANTLELIFMTGLSSWRIAWGKWASLMFQAVLFVLAVLPYGVLRYFFGGVNLSDDFITLGSMLLTSAVISAVALAVSGLPNFVRVGAIIFFAFFGMTSMQGFLFFSRIGPGGIFGSSGFGVDSAWPLLIFDATLICVGALTVGASSIAPIAENHAFRQRLVVLAAWLPIPAMKFLGMPDEVIAVQCAFFVALGMAATWSHLAVAPTPMRVHMEPFARRGRLVQLVGFTFQPGWPGAVLFLMLVEILFAGAVLTMTRNPNDGMEIIALVIMAGAALLTGPLIWAVFRVRTKATLVLQTLVIALGATLAVMANATGSVSLGHEYTTAIFPPFGFFSMLDGGLRAGYREGWLLVGLTAFVIQAGLLFRLARSYWSQMLAHGRDIRSTPMRKPVPMPLEVAA